GRNDIGRSCDFRVRERTLHLLDTVEELAADHGYRWSRCGRGVPHSASDLVSNIGWKYLTPEDKSAILRGVADGKAYAGPFHAEIYPADRCNIECFFCSTAAIRGTDELSLQRIEELIDELKRAGTRSIRLAGGGEPLFHRKTKDMLRRISAAQMPIENLTTNAVLLDEETAGILADCCDEVTVSLNTVGGESYSQMMQT